MASRLFNIVENAGRCWSKWFSMPRRHDHVCCTCLSTHTLEQRVRNGEIEERWCRRPRATAGYRRAWSAEKRRAFEKFMAIEK